MGRAPEIQPPPLRRPLPRRVEAERKADVIVIGAGILGACTAYFLAREGVDVAILDRGPANGEASGGNAGSLHVQLLSYDFGDRAQKGARPLRRRSLCSGIRRGSGRRWSANWAPIWKSPSPAAYGRGGRGDARPSPAQGKARAIIWNPCRNPERCRPARARAPRLGSYDRRRVVP